MYFDPEWNLLPQKKPSNKISLKKLVKPCGEPIKNSETSHKKFQMNQNYGSIAKNIGRNPIVDCEQNGEKIEINRIEKEMEVQLENGNKSPFTNWKYNSN